MYAASALAANTIARSACGAAAPLFTNQMFKAMGVGGGGSLIGGLAALLGVVPFIFYKYGKGIRVRSKFAPTKDKMEAKQPDVERVVTQTQSEPDLSRQLSGETERRQNEEQHEHSDEMSSELPESTEKEERGAGVV